MSCRAVGWRSRGVDGTERGPGRATESGAGPVPYFAGVGVDEAGPGVVTDAAEVEAADEFAEGFGGRAAHAEVDGGALHVLAFACDLVALLAQHEVVFGRAIAGYH